MSNLKAGHTIKTVKYEETDPTAIKDFTTLLLAAWDDANFQRKKLDSALTPTPTPAAGSPGTTSVDTKKVFDPAKWKKYVAAYNNQKINGQPRNFPEKILLGADETLIRMDGENDTRMFTPVSLGEILANRIYTSYDTMNKNSRSLQKNDRDFQVTVSDKKDGPLTISGQKRQEFEPNSSMLIMDGATAAGWAKKLFAIGNETDIDQYISWFNNNVRANNDKLWQLKELWEASEWAIALKMRTGETFGEAMKLVIHDIGFKNDILNRSPTKTKRTDRSKNWLQDKKDRKADYTAKDKDGNGGGKGARKDKDKGGKGGKGGRSNKGGGGGKGGKGGRKNRDKKKDNWWQDKDEDAGDWDNWYEDRNGKWENWGNQSGGNKRGRNY